MKPTKQRTPTPEQRDVINSEQTKIAISASAGSGKTTTIIDRIARMIQKGSCRFDQLLVLTFTDASAQDMRLKLKKQLAEQLDTNFSPVELQAAAIGTFHSFCANIVRAWFTVAGVSPSFAVMDTIESAKLKSAIFEQMVLNHYADVKDAVDLFAASRNLDDLRQVVFAIHDFLATREDRATWLRETALAAYNSDVDHNPAVRELMKYYQDTARRYRQIFAGFGPASSQVKFLLDVADQIIGAQSYTDFGLLNFTFPKVKQDDQIVGSYERFKDLRTDFKDLCQQIPTQFKFSVAEIQADIQTDRRIVEQLLQLVQIFDAAYSAKKIESKKLDYNDLEKYALKVLECPEAVDAIRAQYKYIFVDEGQDTNPIQYKIIDILCGDDKFFCIVGDIKQSIYGFRECEPELFKKKLESALFTPYSLNKNWRSVNPILKFVNDVMAGLMADYNDKHKFPLDGQSQAAASDSVTIATTVDVPSQMELVYQQIKTAKRPLGDIAVLAETSAPLKELQKYLADRGVASVIDRSTDALAEPAVVLLNHCLFAAMNPTNELSRYIVLQTFFGCSNDDLAHLRLGKTGAALNQKVADCDAFLGHYRHLGRTTATYEVLSQLATELGMLEIPVVSAFLTAIRGVGDFDTVARYLYLIEHKLVTVEVNVGANANNAVKLMTIHHSKGLEFPMVILFNFGSLWSQRNKLGKIMMDKNLGICVASVDTENYVHKSPVLRQGIFKYQQAIHLEEMKRLLYVALTRAKEQLYIVGCWRYNADLIRPNCMLDLINPGNLQPVQCEQSPVVPVAQATTAPATATCQAAGRPEVLVKQSVTALATASEPFQDYVAPMKFGGEGGKEFGTAIHRQIQYGDLPAAVQGLVDGYTVYRELPFLYLQDGTIVQGIMDLLAVKDDCAIIVDYKTTRLPREKLVTKYREQLRLYAAAIPGYRVRAYIYSTVHDALIEVSF